MFPEIENDRPETHGGGGGGGGAGKWVAALISGYLALPGGIQHEEKDDQGPPPRL